MARVLKNTFAFFITECCSFTGTEYLSMKYFLPLFFSGLLFFSCVVKKQDALAVTKFDIMEADRAFSAMSETNGLRNAYIEFIDSNGVLLRPGNLPFVGGDAMDFISQSNDTTFTMTWEPKSATIATSGDMGYSYGVYSIKPATEDTVYYGTYVTIWKRQANGKWKFVLQSGNDGVE